MKTIRHTFAQFKKDLKVMDYDFESQSIDSVVAEWWHAQFGCSNKEKEKQIIEMWRNE